MVFRHGLLQKQHSTTFHYRRVFCAALPRGGGGSAARARGGFPASRVLVGYLRSTSSTRLRACSGSQEWVLWSLKTMPVMCGERTELVTANEYPLHDDIIKALRLRHRPQQQPRHNLGTCRGRLAGPPPSAVAPRTPPLVESPGIRKLSSTADFDVGAAMQPRWANSFLATKHVSHASTEA